MNKKIFTFICVFISILAFSLMSSCKTISTAINNTSSSSNNPSSISVPETTEMFTDADKNPSYDIASANLISISNDEISSSSSTVFISDDIATISSEGSYIIEGNSSNCTIVVDANKAKVRLILSNVTISNDNYPPIYIKNADKVFIILDGDNSLSVTEAFISQDENSVDGVIFSKDDITIQGDGSLTMNSSKHGIVGKDDVKITGGNIHIISNSHGIDANDSVRIRETTLNINSGKDGIHVENSDDTTKGYFYLETGDITINSSQDGIDASGSIIVSNGSINIISGNGSSSSLSSSISSKGIKASKDFLISNGIIDINSCDDCIHSNSSIEIDDGTFSLSSADDGIHADDSLIILNGTIDIKKSYEGLEGQNITIENGNISVVATDDGINAAGGNDSSSLNGRFGQNSFNSNSNSFINISGGNIYVNSCGDGIDANGSISVSGGTTVIEGPSDSGNGALDYDGSATITNGIFIAIGSSGMAMNFSSAEQGSILLNFSSQTAGTNIALSDSDNNIIFSMTSSKKYSSVLISAPSIYKGESYTLTAGTYTNTITLSSLIYGSSSQMGGGGMGGGFRP